MVNIAFDKESEPPCLLPSVSQMLSPQQAFSLLWCVTDL